MRYVRTVLLAMVAAGLVITAGCSLFGKKKPKWTILAYYDGNCNLDTTKNATSWVIAEAQEMEKVGSTDQVQVFAMMGSLKTGGNCKYYHFEKHENELPDQISSTVIEELGTKDMSDKRTLKDFIIAGRTRYPAEHYLLMIKDHGGGWRGACVDDQNGAHRMMSLPELREALDTFDFDIISFDACLMSMVEVAYELRQHAKYLVASQFVTYAGTYGSAEWLGFLTAAPTSSALDLAKKIATACLNADILHQVTGHQAVTDLDTTKIKALAAKIGTLGNDLVTYTGQYGAEVLDAFTQTHSTELDDPAFCDIREFCVKLLLEPHLKDINVVKDDANAVVSALNDCIPLTTTNATGVPRGGLCIHFPYQTDMFDSSNYVKCQFTATNWPTFLSKFIGAVGGGTTGNIHIVSSPAGAEIWLDGSDLGAVTPATVQGVPAGTHAVKLTLANYQDWTDNGVQVTAGQTAEVNATLVPVGGGNATISGTVTWPGHTLDQYTFAILDTVNGAYYAAHTLVNVNPANGSFQISVNLPSALPQVIVTAVDDVNNDGYINAGDGFGWWDRDGSGGTMPNTGDIFSLSPGQQVTGANMTLLDVTDQPAREIGRGNINWAH